LSIEKRETRFVLLRLLLHQGYGVLSESFGVSSMRRETRKKRRCEEVKGRIMENWKCNPPRRTRM